MYSNLRPYCPGHVQDYNTYFSTTGEIFQVTPGGEPANKRVPGIGEYWIIDHSNRKVTVYMFKEKDIAAMKTYTREDTVKSFIFDGFTAGLNEIFE
jgi:predicted RNA-binding protein associated with RNAse of E/G family